MRLVPTLLGGGCLLTALPAPAHACHDEPRDRYDLQWNVGLSVGLTWASQIRFTYGADLRFGRGPALSFARIEGHGTQNARLSGGLQLVTSGRAGELGLAYKGAPRSRPDLGSVFGAHVAAGLWDPNVALQAQGTVPIIGDPRNWDVGGAFFLTVPGKLCFASGRLLRVGTDDAVLPMVCGAPVGEEGARWASAAAAEQASVPAFLRMAAELRAVFAPERLVAAALAAARDEALHAALCLQRSGVTLAPLPLELARPRWQRRSMAALAILAREAWLDGCLGEAQAAGDAELEARKPGPDQAIHARIAIDERRHAELAWAVLSWCWSQGGAARDELVEAAFVAGAPSRERDAASRRLRALTSSAGVTT